MDIIDAVRNCHQAIRIEKQIMRLIMAEDDLWAIEQLEKRRQKWAKEVNKWKKIALDQVGLEQFQNIQRALLSGEL